MKTILKMREITCTGCARSMGKEVGIIPGVYGVNIDIVNKIISVEHTEEVSKEELVIHFEKLGYPTLAETQSKE